MHTLTLMHISLRPHNPALPPVPWCQALESSGLLKSLAEFLSANVPDLNLIAALIGLASAVIDNVPLVAATMGM